MTNPTDITTKILKYSLWGCLYLVLLTVLLLSSKFLFPFITLKTIYFRTLVEVAIGLYTLLALHNSYYRPKFNAVTWSLIAFGGVLILTTVFGVNPYRSFWGNIERGEGLLFISHLLIYSFILSQTFKKKFHWYNYFTFSILVSLAVGLYGIAQQLGWQWAVTNSAGARWSSSLGNAAYLAAFALGHFWLSVMLWWQRPRIYWRIFYTLTAIFNLFLIFSSQTRGALIALFVTILIYFIFLIFTPQRFLKISSKNNARFINIKIKLVLSLFVILLISAPIIIRLNQHAAWVNKYASIRRLATISSKDITVESRLYALDSSWHAWQDRFLLGYGWENYNIAFNKYFHPEIYRDNGSQIWFDRAHNTVMDIAVATGLLGLIIYLSLFGSAIVVAIKYARQHRQNLLLAMTAVGFLIAHFLQNIFVFDSLPTYIMLFAVFGFVAYLGSYDVHQQAAKNIILKPFNYYAALSLIILLSLAFFNFNYQPAKANHIAIGGLEEFYYGHLDQGINIFQKAITMNTYQNAELRQRLAENILRGNNQKYSTDRQKLKNNFDFAISELQQNISQEPLSAQNYLYLMSIYNVAAMQTGDASYLKSVVPTGKKLLKLSPTRPQIYFEMGKAEISLQNVEQGINYFKKAVALNPKTLESHWNLLTAYVVTGQAQPAQQEYQTMLDLGLQENESNLKRLVNIYSSVKAYEIVINIAHKLIELNPDNLEYWTILVNNYHSLGNNVKVKETVQQMLIKFPEKKSELTNFLNSLAN